MGAIATFTRPARVAAAIALLATAGIGCGKNRVLLDVDVRSFMDESTLSNPYNAPPLIPFSARLGDIPVNLVEGFKDFGEAQTATMDIGLEYANEVGQGTGTFVIYFSDDPATLFDTAPVATVNADLSPQTTTTGSLQIEADERVLDLFTAKHFYMGVDMVWVPQGAEPLQGVMTISQIQVHLVSTMGLFN
jgi:hypothetical protein